MDRLVYPANSRLAIRNPAQASTGQQSQTARDHTRLVADNIAKQVTGHNDAVQRARILHHQHSRRIDEVVAELQLRILLLHDLREHVPPQPARRQHVRLVQTPNGRRRVLGQRKLCCQPGDALDLGPRVRLDVVCGAVAVVFFPVAEVDAARQLAHDVEVCASADGGFEGGGVHEGFRCEEAWP